MLRRRYRPFVICAVVIVFLLYRAVHNSWDQQPTLSSVPPPPTPPKPAPVDGRVQQPPAPQPQQPLKDEPKPKPDDKPTKPAPIEQKKPDDDERLPIQVPTLKGDEKGRPPSQPTSQAPVAGEIPSDHGSKVPRPAKNNEEPLRWKDPPKDSTIEAPPAEKKEHWTKPDEHFPLPKASIITLPTAAPKKLPKIQYSFGAESESAKAKRVERQAKVKAELERSWSGYRKHAWINDELSPVSGKYRDPFCGWAATLVDSLDTLWIAGMKDEFDEAAKAVKDIDFTYTHRLDIPVFETTIRYLGGLVAAYDVSGGSQGTHAFLLDKAQELAEILMGIFDTPNRMPVLYYQWKPKYTSQPHMAGRVGIAELGTLSMEFTRLAQLTGQHKYYDAIDRITNALIDLQKRGTLIPGLFPESLDASGCNRTATALRDAASQAAKDQVAAAQPLDEPQGYGAVHDESAPLLNSVLDINRSKQRPSSADDKVHRRAIAATGPDGRPPPAVSLRTATDKMTGGPLAANGDKAAWDCVPQGLEPSSYGYQNYHVGGGQDSAYEYFPKVGNPVRQPSQRTNTCKGISIAWRPRAQVPEAVRGFRRRGQGVASLPPHADWRLGRHVSRQGGHAGQPKDRPGPRVRGDAPELLRRRHVWARREAVWSGQGPRAGQEADGRLRVGVSDDAGQNHARVLARRAVSLAGKVRVQRDAMVRVPGPVQGLARRAGPSLG